MVVAPRRVEIAPATRATIYPAVMREGGRYPPAAASVLR